MNTKVFFLLLFLYQLIFIFQGIDFLDEGFTATFTVRKISDGIGVERTFPTFSPNIESIVLHKSGRVRRSKLYFLRERSGKSARIKEKKRATT